VWWEDLCAASHKSVVVSSERRLCAGPGGRSGPCVLRVVQQIRRQSQTLDNLARERHIAIVDAMYDVATGDIEFLVEDRIR
jgi:hypothetical protein